ncbi:MAG: hypothetical protein BWX68_03034 [Verrucomicrobia bacterium ADurb.Bin063]|nr:MAG: hypothetical protein BWX68_03034 [Verrucomicrobia bacterium ADurb.Bin063]
MIGIHVGGQYFTSFNGEQFAPVEKQHLALQCGEFMLLPLVPVFEFAQSLQMFPGLGVARPVERFEPADAFPQS